MYEKLGIGAEEVLNAAGSKWGSFRTPTVGGPRVWTDF